MIYPEYCYLNCLVVKMTGGHSICVKSIQVQRLRQMIKNRILVYMDS